MKTCTFRSIDKKKNGQQSSFSMSSEESSDWDSNVNSSIALSTIYVEENISNKSIYEQMKQIEQIYDVIDQNQVSVEQLVFTYICSIIIKKILIFLM